jgi:hypothetical protein
MRKLILLLCLMPLLTYGQAIYTDPLVTGAIIAHDSNLKSEQNKTNNLLSQIRTAQATVTAQLQVAYELQNKIYKGLSEVSSLVSDAYYVKRTYENCQTIVNNAAEITTFITRNPQYAVFAKPEVNEFKNRTVLLTAEVTTTLTGGQFNLMNSGQRRELVRNIEMETALLASTSWLMLYSMKRAKDVGFWKSINPFSSYVNRDRQIARDIINQAKYL